MAYGAGTSTPLPVSSYAYNARNEMTSATTGGSTISYAYDADGHRTQQSINGTVTKFVWNEFSAYGDVLVELNSSDTVTASYVYGAMGLLSQNVSGTKRYLLTDVQGSTRLLLNSNNTVAASYTYSPFGTPTGDTSLTKYLYTGQQYDSTTQLYSLRARYYAPEQGRFLSRDPYPYNLQNPRELNRYVYTANNPIMGSDPSGFNLTDLSNNIKETVQKALPGLSRAAAHVNYLYTHAYVRMMTLIMGLPLEICIIAELAGAPAFGAGCGAAGNSILNMIAMQARSLMSRAADMFRQSGADAELPLPLAGGYDTTGGDTGGIITGGSSSGKYIVNPGDSDVGQGIGVNNAGNGRCKEFCEDFSRELQKRGYTFRIWSATGRTPQGSGNYDLYFGTQSIADSTFHRPAHHFFVEVNGWVFDNFSEVTPPTGWAMRLPMRMGEYLQNLIDGTFNQTGGLNNLRLLEFAEVDPLTNINDVIRRMSGG